MLRLFLPGETWARPDVIMSMNPVLWLLLLRHRHSAESRRAGSTGGAVFPPVGPSSGCGALAYQVYC